MAWPLELALIGLLAATLFHAIRLERALVVLKRDRAMLEELVSGFSTSTRQAEQGIERLRGAADGAGRQIARQIEAGTALKDDLMFLVQRGEQVADRLDALVRAARGAAPEAARAEAPPSPARETPRLRSEAERELLKALRLAR
jgi:hypothetical protein